MIRFGIKPDVLFVDMKKQPGPPYGKAYGYWRKHPNRMTSRDVTDDDVRFWVGVRTVSAYVGISAEAAYERHASGEGLSGIAGKHHRAGKPGNGNQQPRNRAEDKGKGKGKKSR